MTILVAGPGPMTALVAWRLLEKIIQSTNDVGDDLFPGRSLTMFRKALEWGRADDGSSEQVGAT